MVSAATSTGAAGGNAGVFACDLAARIPAGFRLDSGETLAQAEVKARLHGRAGAPLVAVAGGISAGRCPHTTPEGERGWWAEFVRPGGPIDLDRLQVLAFDFAPDAETAPDRPLTLTTHDQARLLALVLDEIGATRLDAFIGSSYGGMVGLAFAELFPERIGRLIALCAAHRSHPMTTALRGIQRRILGLAAEAGRPEEGVALARELAMTTYRSADEFAARFDDAVPAEAGGRYPVCDYLTSRGRAYAGATTVSRWISLSDSMDRHRVQPEKITTPTTLIGFPTDRLVPIDDLRELAARLPQLERLHEISSVYGHDGFLKEAVALTPLLRSALPQTEVLAA
jgi:homoserine O-acetyltransferase